MTAARVFVAGCSPRLRAAIERVLSRPVQVGVPEEPAADDLVILAAENGVGVPFGNAFSACRAIKQRRSDCRVAVALRTDDTVSEGIARFCGADGCLRVDADDELCDPDALAALAEGRRRRQPAGASRLDRVASSLDDRDRRDTALQRMLEEHRENRFLDRLNDPETGLFDGPFAAFKLDEEFKRAMRFHEPLSLILIDCGGDLPAEPSERRLVLAEVASVFLTECRDIDTLARFTETVFMFLLPGTGSDGAAAVARRMLDGLKSRQYSAAATFTPAAGVATVPMAGIADRAAFLRHVEACLEVARGDAARSGLCVS